MQMVLDVTTAMAPVFWVMIVVLLVAAAAVAAAASGLLGDVRSGVATARGAWRARRHAPAGTGGRWWLAKWVRRSPAARAWRRWSAGRA